MTSAPTLSTISGIKPPTCSSWMSPAFTRRGGTPAAWRASPAARRAPPRTARSASSWPTQCTMAPPSSTAPGICRGTGRTTPLAAPKRVCPKRCASPRRSNWPRACARGPAMPPCPRDGSHELRRWLEERGLGYALMIPKTTAVWDQGRRERPEQVECRSGCQACASHPTGGDDRVIVEEGRSRKTVHADRACRSHAVTCWIGNVSLAALSMAITPRFMSRCNRQSSSRSDRHSPLSEPSCGMPSTLDSAKLTRWQSASPSPSTPSGSAKRGTNSLHSSSATTAYLALIELLGPDEAQDVIDGWTHYTWIYATVRRDVDTVWAIVARHGLLP
jgi:hypothetical protein